MDDIQFSGKLNENCFFFLVADKKRIRKRNWNTVIVRLAVVQFRRFFKKKIFLRILREFYNLNKKTVANKGPGFREFSSSMIWKIES